jgi:hypothetical protein
VLYEQYFIDDLKDRADLVRIIEPYAALKKKGSSWMGLLPVSLGEDAVLFGVAGERILQMLWLRKGRQRFSRS